MSIPKFCRWANIAPGVRLAFGLLVLLLATLTFTCQPNAQPGKTVAPIPTPTPQPVVTSYPPGFGAPVLGRPYPGTGVLKLINRKEGWVEIDHEDIKDLMPAMTMEFWIRDPAIMKSVKVGDRVDFVVVEDSKGEYLTELKKVPPGR